MSRNRVVWITWCAALLMMVGCVCLAARNPIPIGDPFAMFTFKPTPPRRQPPTAVKSGGVKRVTSPLILVGGLGGSALMSHRKHANEPHFWCHEHMDPFQIWISVEEMIPYVSEDCFVHDMLIELRDGLLRQRDPGVFIYGKDMGGLGGLNSVVEGKNYGEYMRNLTSYLIQNGGYQAGVSLRGFTYDWRLGVVEWMAPVANNTIGGDFAKLKWLVEDTFQKNEGKKVSMLGHSMGGPFLQYFLANYVSQEWKDRYVLHFLPLAGAFDGSPLAPILYTTGTNYGIPIFTTKNSKAITQAFAGPLFMAPTAFPFKYPFFTTSNENYHANPNDYMKLFENAKIIQAKNIFYHEYETYVNDKFKAPNVSTHCIFGYGVPSLTSLEYTGKKDLSELDMQDILSNAKVLQMTDGDGTVPAYSLEICGNFKQTYPVVVHKFFNATHIGIIQEERVFELLLKILQ